MSVEVEVEEINEIDDEVGIRVDVDFSVDVGVGFRVEAIVLLTTQHLANLIKVCLKFPSWVLYLSHHFSFLLTTFDFASSQAET